MGDEPDYDEDDAADWWQQQDNEMQRYEQEMTNEVPRESIG